VGGRTGFGIHAPAEEYVGQRFRQGSSDYITIAFVLVSALMSMRRMTS
jgi:hypothetical protein